MIKYYSVIYSSKARDDLKEIYSYISLRLLEPLTARNQVNKIRQSIKSLNFMPFKYPLVDWEPWKSKYIHKVPVDNFVIFYSINEENLIVTIIRIVYGGQNIANIVTDSN
jgi:addiction module toxin, relE/stbE family